MEVEKCGQVNIELELYKKMYLIRACEEAIIREYNNDGMKTPMHMSMGSEHISSAICLALGDRAQVFSSYRSHAPFIARTEDTDQFFLEMYGRKESVVGGRGGSMHLCYPEKGFIMSSAVVASQISVACGYAWANKQKKNDKVVVVFFGDGAIEEGGFWESLNIACLYELPIMFVCEDNDLAVHTSQNKRTRINLGYKLETLVTGFHYNWHDFASEGCLELHEQIVGFNMIIQNTSPSFFHCSYHRMLEHVGIDKDYEAGYRIRPDNEVDPVKLLGNQFFRDDRKDIEYLINEKVKKSLEAAKSEKNNLLSGD